MKNGTKRVLTTGVIGVLALGLICAGWFDLWPHDERTSAALQNSAGTIDFGRRFGVKVGDGWKRADEEVRSQFTPGYVLWTTPRPPPAYEQPVDGPVLVGDANVTYRDRSWRNGLITLKLHDGHVVQVTWTYSPFYVDL